MADLRNSDFHIGYKTIFPTLGDEDEFVFAKLNRFGMGDCRYGEAYNESPEGFYIYMEWEIENYSGFDVYAGLALDSQNIITSPTRTPLSSPVVITDYSTDLSPLVKPLNIKYLGMVYKVMNGSFDNLYKIHLRR